MSSTPDHLPDLGEDDACQPDHRTVYGDRPEHTSVVIYDRAGFGIELRVEKPETRDGWFEVPTLPPAVPEEDA